MLTTFQKTLVILHLCLAFSTFLWVLFDPFLGQHFRTRGDILLIENLRGDKALQEKVNATEKEVLEQNYALWNSLEPETQQSLLSTEGKLIAQIHASFWEKTFRGFNHLLVKTPFFELAWIVFSLVIGILCLKGNEGAKRASLILPLLVVLYALDQAQKGGKEPINLYPTEKEIVQNYLKHPLSKDLMTQKEELLHAFDLYLIEKWAQAVPSTDSPLFKQQVIQGTFLFNLAQIKQKISSGFQTPYQSEHSALLLMYLMWNLSLSIALSKKKTNEIKVAYVIK